MNANPDYVVGGNAKANLHVENGSLDVDSSPNTDIDASSHACPRSVSDSTAI